MVIDGRRVITGSFNFIKAAEDKNAENLLVITNPEVAAKYRQNWQVHRQARRITATSVGRTQPSRAEPIVCGNCG